MYCLGIMPDMDDEFKRKLWEDDQPAAFYDDDPEDEDEVPFTFISGVES